MNSRVLAWLGAFCGLTVFGQVETRYYPASSNHYEVVAHQDYTLGYCEEWEQAAWVVEVLRPSMFEDIAERKDNFRADKSVSTGSAAVADYTKSGYDKGHLAPAGDFTYDETAMYESFYMSNMSPQVPNLNRGCWATLEDWVREMATKEKTLVVVTGPIVTGEVARIGSNGVAVPHLFYKALYDTTPPCKMIGFLYANEANQPKAIADHVVSVDEIERLSGLDLFSSLDQEELESSTDLNPWLTAEEKKGFLLILL